MHYQIMLTENGQSQLHNCRVSSGLTLGSHGHDPYFQLAGIWITGSAVMAGFSRKGQYRYVAGCPFMIHKRPPKLPPAVEDRHGLISPPPPSGVIFRSTSGTSSSSRCPPRLANSAGRFAGRDLQGIAGNFWSLKSWHGLWPDNGRRSRGHGRVRSPGGLEHTLGPYRCARPHLMHHWLCHVPPHWCLLVGHACRA